MGQTTLRTRNGAKTRGETIMSSLILPAASMAAITVVVYIATTIAATIRLRRRVAREGPADTSAFSEAPDWLDRPRRNYNSLLQMPVLFYAVIALELARDGVDQLQVQLAWTYVLVRVIHSGVYIAFNPLVLRMVLLAASAAILAGMWIRLVVSVL